MTKHTKKGADIAKELKTDWDKLAAELNHTKKQVEQLQTQLVEARQDASRIRDSFSFRIGSLMVQAVRKPGSNTILLPYRVLRLFFKKNIAKTTGSSKAYILATIRERINTIKGESNYRNMYAEPRRRGLRIAVIMDRFSYDCFKYEAELITFTSKNWKRVLSKHKPDFLFVESAWQGNDSSWRYQIINLEQRPNSQLPELVKWCQAHGISTAFWNKEDPAHYDDFLNAARLFDRVYTIDAGCVAKYKKDLNHDRVYCLPFAAQPKIHNPVGSSPKIRDLAFAGAWYEGNSKARKHRREQMANVVTPSLLYDVDIYDRNYLLGDERHRFPKQYQPCIVGQLPYDEMVYAYKMYKIFLNVSSVSESPTFLPRRVLEILASGTCVLSGYSKGILNLLGADIVPMSSNPQETVLLLKKFLEDDELRERIVHLGRRKVMKEHTYEKRLEYVLDTIGISKTGSAFKKKGISVITCTNKLGFEGNILANYDRQSYENKELIIVLNNNRLDLDEWETEAKKHQNVTVYRVDEKESLGFCLNYAVDKAQFDYIAKCDDDDYYAPAYLEDMLNAFDYSGADIVGKRSHYVYIESNQALAVRFPDDEHRFVKHVPGSTLVARREVFNKVGFISGEECGEDTQFLKDCLANGLRVYSADRFNYIAFRRTSKESHTWKVPDEEILVTSQLTQYEEGHIAYATC